MANEQNLLKGEDRHKFTDQDRERARKSRLENLSRKKSLRQTLEVMMETPMTDKMLKAMEKQGFDTDDVSYRAAVCYGLISKAVKGDVSAINQIAKLLGEDVTQIEMLKPTSETVKEMHEYFKSRETTDS